MKMRRKTARAIVDWWADEIPAQSANLEELDNISDFDGDLIEAVAKEIAAALRRAAPRIARAADEALHSLRNAK